MVLICLVIFLVIYVMDAAGSAPKMAKYVPYMLYADPDYPTYHDMSVKIARFCLIVFIILLSWSLCICNCKKRRAFRGNYSIVQITLFSLIGGLSYLAMIGSGFFMIWLGNHGEKFFFDTCDRINKGIVDETSSFERGLYFYEDKIGKNVNKYMCSRLC